MAAVTGNGQELLLSNMIVRSNNSFFTVMKSIIELVPEHRIQPIIFTSARGVAETGKDIPGWFSWFIEHSHIRYPYGDSARHEELLKQTSLQWTAVRAAGRSMEKAKGQSLFLLIRHRGHG